MNPYDILEINKYSSKEEIRLAYKRMMKKYHPDSSEGDTTKLNEAKSAYIRLKDSTPVKILTIPIVVTVTHAELVNMLGKTQMIEYSDVHFEVYIPYDVRMGDVVTVNILTDTKLKIKFKERHEQQ